MSAAEQTAPNMRAVAQFYARHGWRVFPLKPAAKVPLTEHGCLDATRDVEQVAAWWQRWPTANVGIATGAESGLLVVDIDGEEGELALAELTAQHGALPLVPEVITGRGRHLYFSFDERVKNSAKRLPKIDTRSTGGYVVAPPSVHPDGRRYEWGAGKSPRERSVAPAPEWLVELFAPRKASPTPGAYRPSPAAAPSDLDASSARYRAWFMHALEGEARDLASEREGSRGSAANRSAYKLAGYLPNLPHGLVTERDIELELLASCVANGLVAKDGIDKVRATIRRGLEAGRSSPRDVPMLEDRPDSRVARPAPLGRSARTHDPMPVDDGAGDAPPPSDDDYEGPSGPRREELPVIFDTFDEDEMARLADRYFASDPELYQRGGMLVQVLTDTSPGAGVTRSHEQPRITPIEEAYLRAVSTRCVRWMRRRVDKDGEVEAFEIKPPRHAIAAFRARKHWMHMRKLEGVSSTPLFLASGEILSRPGFDAATGMLFIPNEDFGQMPSKPTRRDVEEAVETLRYIVSDFPFESASHEATFFAAVLTPLARPAFKGPAPLFLIDATTQGTGKGLLAKIIGLLATGAPPRLVVMNHNDDEVRKTITTIAIDGDQIVNIDNIENRWGPTSLAVALTGDKWSDRILGGSTSFSGQLTTTWIGTGNNVQLTPDMARRVAHIRLIAGEEKPDERTGFQIPKLEKYVREHRPHLVRAALTILRGWHVADRPEKLIPNWGSYEGWSEIIRQAIVWAGLADPSDARAALRDASDSSSDQLAALITAMVEAYTGEPFTSGELVAKAKGEGRIAASLKEALEAYVGNKGPLAPKSVGRYLKLLRGRVVEGQRIAGAHDAHRKQWVWWVETTKGEKVVSTLSYD